MVGALPGGKLTQTISGVAFPADLGFILLLIAPSSCWHHCGADLAAQIWLH
ncbi:MAG: hypothetical protein WCC64_11445 [Aliidongia sp.]